MLTFIVIFSFLAFPPILLAFKFLKKKPAWWLMVLLMVLFVFLGWGLLLSAYIEEQTHINELLDQGRHEELPKGWDSDGASGVFAMLGGWLIPLAYLIFWLAVYALAAIVRGVFKPKAKDVIQ
jgi:hypothetical protein